MNKLSESDVQHLHAAAEKVSEILNSLQIRFHALANSESCAMDQTLLGTHAYSYAELAHIIGTLPQREDVRVALSIVGVLPAIETHLHALATAVEPSLYVHRKAARRSTDVSRPPAAVA